MHIYSKRLSKKSTWNKKNDQSEFGISTALIIIRCKRGPGI